MIKTGTIGDMAIPAGGTMEVVIDALPVDIREDADYFIRFSATQKSATWWAEAGYEVASEQIQLRNAWKSPYRVPEKGNLTVERTAKAITVTGSCFKAIFSVTEGTLESYVLNGKSIICEPLKLNVFRVPTDNDKTHSADWDNMGLRNLKVKAGTWDVKESVSKNLVDLSVTNVYTATLPYSFTTQFSFKVMDDGTIFVSSVIDPAIKMSFSPKSVMYWRCLKVLKTLHGLDVVHGIVMRTVRKLALKVYTTVLLPNNGPAMFYHRRWAIRRRFAGWVLRILPVRVPCLSLRRRCLFQ